MKIERIKKSHKKEIVRGGLILVSIVSAITLVTTRAKYRVTQDIKLVNGTVNYKVPDLRLVAVYLNDGNGDVETNNIPTNGYNLNTDKSICKVYDGTTSIENAPKDNNIKIEYNNGKINILGVSKKNTRCYLYFDKIKGQTSDSIIAGITVKPGTPTFANAATTDEGVYSASDGMYGGTSYYWRGASTTNHVVFANKCWRIVRINGDGTIRLIYNGAVSSGTCTGNGSNAGSIAVTSQAYNPSYNRSEYVGWTYSTGTQRTTSGTASNIKSQTDSWYSTNIKGTDAEKVADGKFCNDRNTASGSTWSSQPSSTFYYAGYDRSGAKSASSVTPTLSCPEGDVYTLKAGAITMDEVVMAGAKWGTANSSYYLYNGQYYWTMSPYSWYGGNPAGVFYVYNDGRLTYYRVDGTYGVRPVINLKSDTTFATGGEGTQNNPYVVQ